MKREFDKRRYTLLGVICTHGFIDSKCRELSCPNQRSLDARGIPDDYCHERMMNSITLYLKI